MKVVGLCGKFINIQGGPNIPGMIFYPYFFSARCHLPSMVGMLVPVKGGIGGIVHPPIGRKNATYIPLIVLAFWGVICYLLGGSSQLVSG